MLFNIYNLVSLNGCKCIIIKITIIANNKRIKADKNKPTLILVLLIVNVKSSIVLLNIGIITSFAQLLIISTENIDNIVIIKPTVILKVEKNTKTFSIIII